MKSISRLLAVGWLWLSLGNIFGADARSGLLSYWPLDVDNGGATPDLSFGNDMAIAGGSTIGTGQVTNGFSFNGTSQYLSITHGTDNSVNGLPIYSSASGYTICLWVKGPPVGTGGNVNDHYIFGEGSTTSGNPLLVLQTRNGTTAAATNKLDVFIRTTGGTPLVNHLKSTAIVFDNNWHHIAWVDDHGSAKLYVDGNLDATSFNYVYTAGSVTMNTTAIAALVRASVGGWFNGSVDDVAIWQRPLSQIEVNQVRTNGIAIPAAPEIVQQPVGSTNAMGDRATFSVSAVGLPPLAYQWFKNGAPLTNQTTRTLILTDLTANGSNSYSVTITNVSGSVTSDSVPLVVVPDAAPDPSFRLVSYWPLDTVNYLPTTTNSPDIYYNHADLVLANMDSNNLVAGQFSNFLTFNGASQYGKRVGGSPIYNTTNYTIAFWVAGASGQNNKQVFAEGDPGGSFFLLGTENSASGDDLLNVKASPNSTLSDRKSTRVVFDGTRHHVVWVDENGRAKLYVDGVLDETDYTYTRSNLVLSVTAVGALFRSSPANYFTGALDEVAVWNRRLSYTEIQQIRATSVPPPSIVGPAITQQPVGSTNRMGERAILSVGTTGSAPLSYQWLKDGVPLAGQTNSTLSLFLTAGATNNYWVTITNLAGSVTSGSVPLVVLPDAAADVSAGLLYYWPLDAVSDAPPVTTPDLYSHDDLLLNGMDSNNLLTGQFSNALAFDGFQQYGKRVGGFPVYLTTNYTISFWVNGSPGQFNKQVFAEGGTSGNYFLLGTENSVIAGGLLNVKINPGMADRKSTRVVFDNTWHHVVWVDENGRAKLYVDGVLDETDYSYTRGSLSLESTAIGALFRTTAANYFAGYIDEVTVWNRRVTWTEIEQVHASGIPALGAPIPPAIFTQPKDKTNDVWATDLVSFSVVVSGTGPLYYQWQKNGLEVPSATNSVLTFASVQTADAGAYSVTITNASGSVTSSVVQLTVIPYTPVTAGEALKLDFDKTNSPSVQPDFLGMTTAMSGTNFGGVKVTVSPIGNISLADRNRAEGGVIVVNSPPGLTQAQLYNDFIFANSTTDGNGMRILIERLAHNTPFGVTIWSFDPQSPGLRVSDWTETASGTPVTILAGYNFDGSVLPPHDYDDTFGALLTSSATGTLQIEGVKRGGASLGVFVNAIRLVAQPVMRITNAELVNGNIRLTIETQYPGQSISIQENADLLGGAWSLASGAGPAETHGPIVIAEFPASAGQLFYRVVSP
jgi:hypothetical protein